jgi:predicted Zn-dependent peptidase
MPVVLARRPGTASFASAMLDEGSGKLDALAFKARAEELGAQLGAGASVDEWTADLSALKDKLDPSLALYADMIRHPTFAPPDIERTKKQRLAQIAQEKAQPVGVAFRLLPPLLYGAGHPYAMPFSGTGTEESVSSMSREDLLAFQREALRPDNATIVVAGDITLGEIVPELDKYFGDWQPPAEPKASHALPDAGAPNKVRVFLVDKPGAVQSTVLAGQLAPSSKYEKRFELQSANSVLGGVFTSRLNMNLREDKHWAYGAGSTMPSALGQRPLIMYAQVQSDKTVESIVEMRKEVVAFVGDKPATAEEVAKVKADEIRTLPGSYETIGAVASQVANMQLYGRPDDYIQTVKARYERQTDADVRAEARATYRPDALTWVIVGDLKKIEKPVRALNLGEVHVMDAEGKVVR